VVAPRLVALLRYRQQQVLPVGPDGVAIGPACAARLESAIVPAQDLERRGLADAASTDRVNDLAAAKEQVPNFATGADADHAVAARQAFHLHQVGQTRSVEARAEAAFAHRVGGLFAAIHRCHGDSKNLKRTFEMDDVLRQLSFQVRTCYAACFNRQKVVPCALL